VTVQDRLLATSFRGPGFDLIRLAAATIVLLHHCRGIQYPDIRNDPLFHYSGGFMDFGRFAVCIFFAISGFLVTPGLLRTGSVVQFGVNRALRIFPGLVVNVVLAMLVLGPILTNRSLTSYYTDPQLYVYAKNILTLTIRYLPGVVDRDGSPAIVNGALWTLHFEVLCYIALMALFVIGLLKRRKLLFALWCLFYAVYVGTSISPTFAAAMPERFVTFEELFVYFASGALLYVFRDRVPFSAAAAIVALALMLVALPLGGGAIVMPVCLSYLTVFCGLSSLPGKVPLKHDLSYGVYLIHAPIMIWFTLAFPDVRTWWIAAAAIFLITLVLAYLSWTYVEGPALGKKKTVSSWVQHRVESVLLMLGLGGRVRTRPAE
jgi:peptidoglycan/LPS O-acetylase OafA/YrhL